MSKTTSKADIVRELAKGSSHTQVAIAEVLDAFFDQVRAKTAEGMTVSIPGFGRFAMKTRSARTARNPRTGEAIEVPAVTQLGFKPVKASKQDS